MRLRSVLLVAINLAAVLGGLLAFGIWQRLRPVPGEGVTIEGTITAGFVVTADDVGYVPKPNQRVTARKLHAGSPIYDVAYTTGPDGFRIVPAANPNPWACVMLLGDSNTFGEGVEDGETYAWRLFEQGKGGIAVHNFGVMGYGPHQMLAGLQSDRFARSLACKPTHAIYFFIPEHIARVVGRYSWDPHGPRYYLTAGRPVRDGNFDMPQRNGPQAPPPDLEEGFLGWRRLLDVRRIGTPEEAELASALIVESARELRKLDPQLGFHVLFWTTYRDPRLDLVFDRLRAAGIVNHTADSIIPGYAADWPRHVLSIADRHPTAATHRLIASYIVHEIVAKGR